MTYVLMFVTCALLLFLSGRVDDRRAHALLTVSGLLLPCLFAGARANTVGVDVYTYAYWQFGLAGEQGFAAFLANQRDISALGWNLVTWLTNRLGGGFFPAYLFVIECFCIFPTYACLRRVARGSEWAGMLVWLLLEYAYTLNGMRQSIAMGFVLLSLSFALEGGRRGLAGFTACFLVALQFHQTAVAGILVYPFSRFMLRPVGSGSLLARRGDLACLVAIVFAVLGFMMWGEQLVRLAARFKASYSYQVEHLGAHELNYSYLYLLVALLTVWIASQRDYLRWRLFPAEQEHPIGRHWERRHQPGRLALPVIAGRTTLAADAVLYVSLGLACTGCLLWQLDFTADTLGRFGTYGVVFACVAGSLLARERWSRWHFIALIVLCLVFFVVRIIVLGQEGAYPYAVFFASVSLY